MKICVVSPFAPNSQGFGGIPRSARVYLRALRLIGATIDYISTTGSSHGKASAEELARENPGVRVTYYEPNLSKRWGVGVGVFSLLPHIAQSELVIVHGARSLPSILAGLACRVLRIPYIVVAHAQLDRSRVARTRAKHPRLYAVTYWPTLWSVRGASAIVVSGTLERDTLMMEFRDIEVVEIENFFDFDPSVVVPRALQREKRYIFVGRIESDKGVLGFARAWIKAAGPQSRFMIAGSGSGEYFRRLMDIATADPRICYVGEIPNQQIAEMIREATLLVLPTGMDDPVTENFGNVVVEALLQGRPAMVTRGLHWDRYADSQALRLFDTNPVAAMTAIRAFEAVSAEEYHTMSHAAADLALNFNINNAVPKLRALVDKLALAPR